MQKLKNSLCILMIMSMSCFCTMIDSNDVTADPAASSASPAVSVATRADKISRLIDEAVDGITASNGATATPSLDRMSVAIDMIDGGR